MPKSHPPYPAEFRRQMVELVWAGRTPEELSREFEPSAQAICNWVRQAERDVGRRQDGPTSAEREELVRLRRVHRAVAELRRGTLVVLEGPHSLVMMAVESAGAGGLAEFAALASGPATLLLAPVRAAAVLHHPVEPARPAVVLRLPDSLLDPERLRRLADLTAEQLLTAPAEPMAVPEQAAALTLVKLARLLPVAITAPVSADPVGTARRLDVPRVPITDVLAYPAATAAWLTRVAEARVPLEDAVDARIIAFRASASGIEHLAILIGRPEQRDAALTRIHSECFIGDLLGNLCCDHGSQLRGTIRRMAEEGAGALLHLAQEGRGVGLVNKLRAYAPQDRGLDTRDATRALGWGADERSFLVAATMLDALGLRRVRLLTNNPDKVAALAACGVEVVARVSHAIAPNGVNDEYLATKTRRFGHLPD